MERFGPIMAVAMGLLMLFVGTAILMGCVTPELKRERPFSSDWVNKHDVDEELRRREKHINRVDSIVLLGSPEEGGAYVGKDAKGDPKLKIGKDNGLGVDLDYSGGPEGKVKYEVGWEFGRPTKNTTGK